MRKMNDYFRHTGKSKQPVGGSQVDTLGGAYFAPLYEMRIFKLDKCRRLLFCYMYFLLHYKFFNQPIHASHAHNVKEFLSCSFCITNAKGDGG
jgi:hypothetical protein